MVDLLRCTNGVFITSQGYARTQMEDIAARTDISKRVAYLCVESNAALFDLALCYADNPESFEPPPVLPVPQGLTAR